MSVWPSQFPWPQSPTVKQIDAVAAAAVHLRRIRTAAAEKAGNPVTPPGIPSLHPDPARLITEDCIRP